MVESYVTKRVQNQFERACRTNSSFSRLQATTCIDLSHLSGCMRINFPLCRRHIGPLIGHGISLRVIRRRLIVACSRSVYLPVGSGHSTLIKVSSMRSAGWGNRSITRTSALSTLPGADRPSPNSKNLLRSYVYPSTKHPAQTLRSLLSIDLREYFARSIVLVWLLREHSPSR